MCRRGQSVAEFSPGIPIGTVPLLSSEQYARENPDQELDAAQGRFVPRGSRLQTEPTSLIGSEDLLTRGRALALEGVPLQISSLFEALAQLRARAAGSTAEILPSIIGQLSQMRAQYSGASQAIARRLGFAGGGQTEREQGKALAGATRQYGGLITGQQQTSFAALIKQLSELQPSLSAAARPPSTSTSASESTQEGQPMNFGQWGQAIAAAVSTARQLQQFYASQSPPTGVQPHAELPAASEATLFGAGGM